MLEKVIARFNAIPELKKYIPYLETTKLSNATLENFLTASVDYIQQYIFWEEPYDK